VNLKKNLLSITGAGRLNIGWIFFSCSPQKNADQKKQVIGGPSIALETPKLEGPCGKIPPPYMASPPLGISNIELLL
jgi:hypothetical protein